MMYFSDRSSGDKPGKKGKSLIKWMLLAGLVTVTAAFSGSRAESSGDTIEILREEQETSEDTVEAEEPVPVETGEETQQEICVFVCGAVKNEGVYTLAVGSRVYEAVAAAGGYTDDAASDYLNQAQLLEDGEKIRIPTQEELLAGDTAVDTSGTDLSAEQDGRININTADEAALMTLPGIGESRAAAILQYRNEHGKFSSIEEIMQVSGIKEASFEKLKDYITVGGSG